MEERFQVSLEIEMCQHTCNSRHMNIPGILHNTPCPLHLQLIVHYYRTADFLLPQYLIDYGGRLATGISQSLLKPPKLRGNQI